MPADRTPTVADNIIAEIARHGRTRSGLAHVWGMSVMAVSRRLSGATPITVDQLIAAARWLDIPVTTLLPDTERAHREPVSA